VVCFWSKYFPVLHSRRISFHIGTLSRCIDGIFGFLLEFLFIGTMILSLPFFWIGDDHIFYLGWAY